jgi:hypothetical protein
LPNGNWQASAVLRSEFDERKRRLKPQPDSGFLKMSKEVRVRIIALQAVMVLDFAFCAGFLLWGSGFVDGMIRLAPARAIDRVARELTTVRNRS